MKEEMRTFGYLCPQCGKTVMGTRSVFALEASNAEVECACGKSALKVEFDGTEYHIYVPCGICGETHEAHCPPERVLRGATALGCAKTRQFCCFIGPEGTVEKNLRDLAVLAEKEHQQQEDGEEAFVDNVIMYEILSELKDIAARPDGITCACGSGRYGMEIRRSAVELICRACGAKLRLPAATDRDLDDLCCHRKLEYVSGLAVSVLILLMGLELGKTSIEKILHPEPVDSSPLIFAILCASILVKLYMFLYNRRLGKKLASPAMEATAMDSLSDSVATAAVLIATLVGRFTGLEIDGWCGVLVAAFILWSGINAVRDTLDPLLGTPPTHEFVQRIRDLVMAHSTILGIHDLIVHDYGPGRVMISLHAEVPANEDVLALHDEIDNVEKELREKLGCDAVIHMDPVVTDDGVTEETRRRVQTLIHCIDDAIDIHDFRMVAGPTHTNLIFDAVVPFGFRLTDQEVEQKIRSAVRALDGNYYAVVNVERSYT